MWSEVRREILRTCSEINITLFCVNIIVRSLSFRKSVLYEKKGDGKIFTRGSEGLYDMTFDGKD